MNTTAQLPSRTATALVTWVATLSLVAVLAAIAGLLAGGVGPATAPALIIGLPVAIKATRSSNRRKAALRHADGLAAQARYQAPACR
uniref:Uncharacterized protein n=1 Tax=Siphoviridae sp. ctgaU3 TaxID=2825609 RepID=A0A8S5UW27_9CAUD|nr:MAG TPA: hypothetical protein [Siphoviridae sp. ctgaU3]